MQIVISCSEMWNKGAAINPIIHTWPVSALHRKLVIRAKILIKHFIKLTFCWCWLKGVSTRVYVQGRCVIYLTLLSNTALTLLQRTMKHKWTKPRQMINLSMHLTIVIVQQSTCPACESSLSVGLLLLSFYSEFSSIWFVLFIHFSKLC